MIRSSVTPLESPTPLPAAARWCDRTIILMLFLFVVAAPHSIAGAQFAWGVALFAWVVRFIFRPRPSFVQTPLDYPLLCFFLLTAVSAFASYAPDISISKLRGASLFTIAYLVAQHVATTRVLRLLVLLLLVSTMVGVLYTFGERAVGRGISVRGLASESPLRATGVQDGDVVLAIDGTSVNNLAQLEEGLRRARDENRSARLGVSRAEDYLYFEAHDPLLLKGNTEADRLGVGDWGRGRDWRTEGFHGHYTTFAEMMQLMTTLVFGLLVALVAARRRLNGGALWLALVAVSMVVSLLLTVTRASWVACFIGAFVILAVGARSRTVIAAGVLAVLLMTPIAFYVLRQQRNVGFLDAKDNSTAWRMTIYREGVELLFKEPRHMLVGVGADSIKRFRNKWGLFDKGRLPSGHFHSTPLQIAVERGLPTLIAWLTLLFVYGLMLWRLARGEALRAAGAWVERGVVLGALGGLCGFATSGLVHYNLGDSEVAMVFYFIIGCTLVIERRTRLAVAVES